MNLDWWLGQVVGPVALAVLMTCRWLVWKRRALTARLDAELARHEALLYRAAYKDVHQFLMRIKAPPAGTGDAE